MSETDRLLSSRDLVERIETFDTSKNGGIVVYDTVDFDPNQFVKEVNGPNSTLIVVPTKDGLFADDIHSEQGRREMDFSRTADFFDLHTDGLGYPHVPPLFVLQCGNQGTHNIPTFFVDSRQVLSRMSADQVEQLERLELVYKNSQGTSQVHPVVGAHSRTGEPVITLSSARGYIRPREDSMARLSLRDQAHVMNTIFEIASEVGRDHTWKTSQAVVFDNERFNHGRGLPRNDNRGVDVTRQLRRVWIAPRNRATEFQRIAA